MFPVKQSEPALRRAAAWAGIDLSPAQIDQLLGYAEWLVAEAIPAGGMGPSEADRMIDRHIADSLTFCAAWGEPPETIVDVGSGVGLPGIPLAIAYPGSSVTLLDRSERRVDLAGRAARVIELDNISVLQGDARSHQNQYHGAAFRGSLPPAAAIAAVPNLLHSLGVGVVGLSRDRKPSGLPSGGPHLRVSLIEVPPGVLDSPAWHLRMSTT
jgi:16S rRNA G527 N7-methylase RsmG